MKRKDGLPGEARRVAPSLAMPSQSRVVPFPGQPFARQALDSHPPADCSPGGAASQETSSPRQVYHITNDAGFSMTVILDAPAPNLEFADIAESLDQLLFFLTDEGAWQLWRS